MALSDAFYQTLVPQVDQILRDLGKEFTIRLRTTYDPRKMEATRPSTLQLSFATDQYELQDDGNYYRTAYGVVADSTDKNNLGSQIFAVTETSQNWLDQKSLLLSPSASPQTGEEVRVDGVWYPLAQSKELKPADIVLLYILGLSK